MNTSLEPFVLFQNFLLKNRISAQNSRLYLNECRGRLGTSKMCAFRDLNLIGSCFVLLGVAIAGNLVTFWKRFLRVGDSSTWMSTRTLKAIDLTLGAFLDSINLSDNRQLFVITALRLCSRTKLGATDTHLLTTCFGAASSEVNC